MSPSPLEDDTLQAYLDRELPADESMALEQRLAREPALAAALIRLAREDAVFREWSQSTVIADDNHRERISPRQRSHRTVRVAVMATLASALAIVVMVVAVQRSFHSTGPNGPALATLEEIQGEVRIVSADGVTEPARSGQSLYAGQEVFTGEDDSSTILRINDSRLTLASETHIRLGRDESRSDRTPTLFIREGIVSAEVLRKTIVLRNAVAELRGKDVRFSFVSLPESTMIETDDGLAQLTRASDGRSINVKSGQFAIVRGNEPLQSQASALRVTTPQRTFAVGSGPVLGLFFDPEGSSMVTATADSVRRWDLNTLKSVATLYTQKKRSIRVFSPSADGRSFATQYDERQARIVDAMTGADLWVRKGTRRITALALAPDARTVAIAWSARDGNEVRLHDAGLGLERVLHTGHVGPVMALAWSPRGTMIATSGPDRSIRIWNAPDLSAVRVLTRIPVESRSLCFSPDEKWLAIGDRKGAVRLLEIGTGSERAMNTGHLRDVTSLAFSPDCRMLASSSGDGTSRVWQVSSGMELVSLKGHASGVASVAFSGDGRMLATGGLDRKVHFWTSPVLR